MARWVMVILGLAMLACSGVGSEPVEEVAPVAPVAPIVVEVVPPPPEPPPKPTHPLPLPEDASGITARFALDCDAEFAAPYGAGEAECDFIDTEPPPAKDPFGCFAAGLACKGECSDPCLSCQRECVGECTDCKTTCAGDPACIEQCATSRQECRESCLEGRDACQEQTCGAVVYNCEGESEMTIRRTCPQCDEIRECILESYREGTFADRPCEMAVQAPQECYEWCLPD